MKFLKWIKVQRLATDIGKDNTKINFTMDNSPLRVVEKEIGLGVVA